jgi:hypothetical protein
MSSFCKDCGVPVQWAKTRYGGTHPPLEYIGQTRIIDRNGVVQQVGHYEPHKCAEVALEVALEAHRQQQAIKQSYEQDREEAQRLSLRKDCTRCGVKAGSPCENLTARAKGEHKLTRWPHQERMPDYSGGPDVDGT